MFTKRFDEWKKENVGKIVKSSTVPVGTVMSYSHLTQDLILGIFPNGKLAAVCIKGRNKYKYVWGSNKGETFRRAANYEREIDRVIDIDSHEFKTALEFAHKIAPEIIVGFGSSFNYEEYYSTQLRK